MVSASVELDNMNQGIPGKRSSPDYRRNRRRCGVMKIFIHPVEAWGHMNACIGMAQILQKRGHRCMFVITNRVRGLFQKYGFEELILRPNSGTDVRCDAHIDSLIHSDIFVESDPLKKYAMFGEIADLTVQVILSTDEQFKHLIRQQQPNLIIVDQILVSPVILMSGLPWISIFSCNPLAMRNDPQLPPPFSGLPIDDQSQWSKYRKAFAEKYQFTWKSNQNRLMKHYNAAPLSYEGISPPSPYLNVYGFPLELDYIDTVPMPDRWFRLETFCREEPDHFELPEDFLARFPPGVKLIYLSLGTLASIRIDLIKKILNVLATTNHGYIVSKGHFDDGFVLPKNMYGSSHLPQTKVLPLVDLVITHGGNNTVTETLKYGKPMLVMPFFADQYDNAERIQQLGYGIRMDPFNFDNLKLCENVDLLLSDRHMKRRLFLISNRMLQSNVTEQLAKLIEDKFGGEQSEQEEEEEEEDERRSGNREKENGKYHPDDPDENNQHNGNNQHYHHNHHYQNQTDQNNRDC